MKHTLSKKEYKELISVICLDIKKYEEEFIYLEDLYEGSKYWETKICGINHILCIILEQFEKIDVSSSEIINFIYNLSDNCNFEIQESDERFIDLLLSNKLNPSISLEEYLIYTQNSIE
ncbi:hypothetical protein [Flavobacterium sp.]|jgi:hypothetical protein|uniref:hypothetical protein n=1 Tax=Flavobacterium sp. TaxID=239 RepID=UPI0037BEA2D8